MRSDAVYASEACAKAARRAHSADKGRTRRPSRDGVGTRVYLTEAELVALFPGLHSESPATALLRGKLARALDRIQAKEKGGPRGSIRRGAA